VQYGPHVVGNPRLNLPAGADVNQEEWEEFIRFAFQAHIRGIIKVLSHLPSSPRCEACGGPFGGPGGRVMKLLGRGPSRKNPRWCNTCFEKSPEGGFVGTVGILFADVRGSTSLGERLRPDELARLMNEFYDRTTRVVVQNGIVDKLIGDEVMGIYLPVLTRSGRLVDALIGDARALLVSIGYGSKRGPLLDVGIGVDVGLAYVGHVGAQGIDDFTAIGDVVNTASRLQARAGPGEIVLREELAHTAGLTPDVGKKARLELKGKSEPIDVRILCGAEAH
jgi:adenylate cyclase